MFSSGVLTNTDQNDDNEVLKLTKQTQQPLVDSCSGNEPLDSESYLNV